MFLDNDTTVRDGQADYYGFLSWKFFEKTHMRGADFLKAMTIAGTADVYFINPYETSIAGLYKNVWSQLESVFPGVMQKIQHCLSEAGYDLDLDVMIMSKDQMAFCNYWLGTKAFWHEYMEFSRPLYNYFEYHLDKKTSAYFVDLDRKNRLGLFPHIMERMFSTFLWARQDRFNAVRIPLPLSIQEVDPSVVVACNKVKETMIGCSDSQTAINVLGAQDVLLSNMLKYKQASDHTRNKGIASKWMSVIKQKVGL